MNYPLNTPSWKTELQRFLAPSSGEFITDGLGPVTGYKPRSDEEYRVVAEGPVVPVEVFYAYAVEDESLRQELEKQLTILKRKQLISIWYVRQISAGMGRAKEINRHVNSAHIILLLVSPDFIASDYCYEVEIRRAMERHVLGETRVIPILLRPVVWDGTPFSRLQVLPAEGKPVTNWVDHDRAFYDITLGIQEVAEGIAQKFRPTRGFEPMEIVRKDYDFALSYASEDRAPAETLADALRQRGAKVFCYSQDVDKKKRLSLLGKNLEVYLFDIYLKRSRYCVVFLSRYYAAKKWTSREQEAILTRALSEKEYIVPIKLDATAFPDVIATIGNVTWQDYTPEEIAESLVGKVREVSHVFPLPVEYAPSLEEG